MKYKQIWKNEKDNKYASITSYIQKENMMKYVIHSTNCRTEMISSSWRWSESSDKEESS